jgi:hypothetical protein
VTEIDLGMPALASLVPISILTGIGTLLVFRRASDQAAVRRAKGLVTAHLLEFRLFMDEPRLILKAQRDLIVANARFMKLMLRPLVVLVLPMALLLAAMEAFYGHAPLRVGDPAIVTAQMKHADISLVLKAPDGIAVETPPVRVGADRQVSWRIRPLRAINTELELVRPDRSVAKSISAGAGMHYLSERRGCFRICCYTPLNRHCRTPRSTGSKCATLRQPFSVSTGSSGSLRFPRSLHWRCGASSARHSDALCRSSTDCRHPMRPARRFGSESPESTRARRRRQAR